MDLRQAGRGDKAVDIPGTKGRIREVEISYYSRYEAGGGIRMLLAAILPVRSIPNS